MTDKWALLQKVSGATKAMIVLNEFCQETMDLPQIKELLGVLVNSDLERIGILELIRQQAEERGLSEESRNLLLGGLGGTGSVSERIPKSGGASGEGPPSGGERKSISVVPVHRKTNPVPNMRLGVGSAQQTTRTPHPHASAPPEGPKPKKGHTFFGGSAAGGGMKTLEEFEAKRARVLVADDDPRIRMIFRMKLQGAGYGVIEAENGDMAWEMLQQEELSALVMDMKMPGIHGLEILARLTKAERKLPVCVCSAYDQLKDEFVVSSYPNLRYFVKPVDADELLAALLEMVPV